jgi:hypothetical protein
VVYLRDPRHIRIIRVGFWSYFLLHPITRSPDHPISVGSQGAIMNRTQFLAVFIIVVLAALLRGQSTVIPPDIDKNGRTITPRPQPHVIYSPADLAHNGITLPASASTPNSNVVPLGGATKSTLYVNCTQIVDVFVNTYQEDGVTVDGTYKVVAALPAGAQQIYIASELAPNSTAGTVQTNVRLPQRAFSFKETNTTATPGTCTDRFVVGY